MNTNKELLAIVNLLSSKYYYRPLFVKGAEDLIFLEATGAQEYKIIVLTTEDFTNVLEKEKILTKVRLVIKKMTKDQNSKAILLSFNSKTFSSIDREMEIHHIFNDNIPDKVYETFPDLEKIDIFDDFAEKIDEKEKDEKAKSIKENQIVDSDFMSTFWNKSKTNKNTQTSSEPLENKKIVKSMLTKNAITKFLLILCLVASLALQFLVATPAGSSQYTSIVAFGGAYGPFVYGYDGIWRLFSYFFISNSVFNFAFLAFAFYFFSRMSESFYGGVRYGIILFLGSVIGALVATQLFPEIVFFSISIPLWILIGSTGTFIVSKWRNITTSIKVRYFLYAILIFIMFGVFPSLGSNIETSLISLLLGIVLGMAVQFKGMSFKENWKKSINPLVASLILVITSIALPLATTRKIPLQSSHLNQSVLVTYDQYNLITSSAREEFAKMNKDYFLVSNDKSSCLWNHDIRFTKVATPISDSQKQILLDSKTKVKAEFTSAYSVVFESQETEIDSILGLFSAQTYATLATELNAFKTSITNLKTTFSVENINTFSSSYNSITNHLKTLSQTETLSIIRRRVEKVHSDVNNFTSIASSATSVNYEKSVDDLIANPNEINVSSFRNELKKINTTLKMNIAGVSDSFISAISTQIANLSYWCVETII